jgi:hypothetical protein
VPTEFCSIAIPTSGLVACVAVVPRTHDIRNDLIRISEFWCYEVTPKTRSNPRRLAWARSIDAHSADVFVGTPLRSGSSRPLIHRSILSSCVATSLTLSFPLPTAPGRALASVHRDKLDIATDMTGHFGHEQGRFGHGRCHTCRLGWHCGPSTTQMLTGGQPRQRRWISRRRPNRSDRRRPGMHALAVEVSVFVCELVVLWEVEIPLCSADICPTRLARPDQLRLGRLATRPMLRRWRLPCARPLPSAATKA